MATTKDNGENLRTCGHDQGLCHYRTWHCARRCGCSRRWRLLDNRLLLYQLSVGPGDELHSLLAQLLLLLLRRLLLLNGDLLDAQLLALQQHLLIRIVDGIKGLLLLLLLGGLLLLRLDRRLSHSRLLLLLLDRTEAGRSAGTDHHLTLALLLQPEHLLLLRQSRRHLALDNDVAGWDNRSPTGRVATMLPGAPGRGW